MSSIKLFACSYLIIIITIITSLINFNLLLILINKLFIKFIMSHHSTHTHTHDIEINFRMIIVSNLNFLNIICRSVKSVKLVYGSFHSHWKEGGQASVQQREVSWSCAECRLLKTHRDQTSSERIKALVSDGASAGVRAAESESLSVGVNQRTSGVTRRSGISTRVLTNALQSVIPCSWDALGLLPHKTQDLLYLDTSPLCARGEHTHTYSIYFSI